MDMRPTKFEIFQDTKYVLTGNYGRKDILAGLSGADSPIFDRLAADYFARDKTTFNLGDYR